jgi:DNA-damage-inducible protein D
VKDLAAEMTGLNVQNKNLTEQINIENEHVDNNLAVRNMLTQRESYPKSPSSRRCEEIAKEIGNGREKT